jgi:formylglycine-generating enzyme required for sulfatase activity
MMYTTQRRFTFLSFFLSCTRLFIVIVYFSACSSQKHDSTLDRIQNSIGMDFVKIPAGNFIMGEATRAECTTCNARPDETPRHAVTISHSFYISTHEVTQKQYMDIMKDNPSRFKGDNHPVDSVSWTAAKLFIQGLNELEKTQSYRLPTEAEWEYAARAGTREAFHFGDRNRDLLDYAWYVINSGSRTHPVGLKKPNPWGLYDMYGNVFEWCEDWYAKGYYALSPNKDPEGPANGANKVKRGGSKDRSARSCRSSARDSADPTTQSDNTGFRIIKMP